MGSKQIECRLFSHGNSLVVWVEVGFKGNQGRRVPFKLNYQTNRVPCVFSLGGWETSGTHHQAPTSLLQGPRRRSAWAVSPPFRDTRGTFRRGGVAGVNQRPRSTRQKLPGLWLVEENQKETAIYRVPSFGCVFLFLRVPPFLVALKGNQKGNQKGNHNCSGSAKKMTPISKLQIILL